MTLPQLGATTLMALAIIVGWIRYSSERTLWRRVLELYLWLVPVSLSWLAAIRTAVGFRATVTVGTIHLLVVAVAVWVLGWKGPTPASDPLLRAAGVLLVLGSAVLWIGANTFPGVELENIHVQNAAHLFTTGSFFLGSVITLAGFTILTTLLRRSAHSVLAELGLVAFLSGFTFWSIHLAFRAVVMVAAAEELSVAGTAPLWYGIWRPWAGVMYGLYMTLAFLSIAAYGGAMLGRGLVGRRWGRTFVAFGLIAAAGFPTIGLFDLPLIPQFGPFAMGIILLRRSAHGQLRPRTASA